MMIPDTLNARWVAALGNDQLLTAEAALRAIFHAEETQAKAHSGQRYVLLQGPPTLINAWHRWSLASNEMATRKLVVPRAR